MYRPRIPSLAVAIVTGAALVAAPVSLAAARTGTAAPVDVDISQRHLNESEEAIAVNPANPSNIGTVTNIGHAEAGLTAGMFEGVSFDGGTSFTRNIQISAGTSNSHDSGNGIDYGDYSGLSFYGGIAHPAWSDNSDSTGNNPDGALHQLDHLHRNCAPAVAAGGGGLRRERRIQC